MKRKICVTTGTRAEYGILRPVLLEIKKNSKLDLHLIAAGMHLSKKHGKTIREIEKDGFQVNSYVDMIPKGNSTFHMAMALGKGVTDFSKIFQKRKPDINVILGDRDEAFASAIAAYHMNIPNAHIHGGERTKAGIDEYNRHAITKVSNIHFAVTKNSKRRIIKMGEDPKYVFHTGSPSIDEIISNRITEKKILQKKYNLEFNGEEIILLQHPVTTSPECSKKEINDTLMAISKFKKPIIALAPNSDAGHSEIFQNLKKFSRNMKYIQMYKNIPRSDFLGLLKNCGVLVGNSSSGIIEGSYFDIPVVNIGIRQQDRERGKNVLDVPKSSISAIHKAVEKSLKRKNRRKFKRKWLYGDGKASKRIVVHLEQIKLDKLLIQKQIFY